ncbi:hypothetical protein VULLAG_LOCUS4758 [Vulpes lagopus]
MGRVPSSCETLLSLSRHHPRDRSSGPTVVDVPLLSQAGWRPPLFLLLRDGSHLVTRPKRGPWLQSRPRRGAQASVFSTLASASSGSRGPAPGCGAAGWQGEGGQVLEGVGPGSGCWGAGGVGSWGAGDGCWGARGVCGEQAVGLRSQAQSVVSPGPQETAAAPARTCPDPEPSPRSLPRPSQ